MQYPEIFKVVKNKSFHLKKKIDIFNISAQNIDCGYTLEPPHLEKLGDAVLTSTHNLCFGAKIRKIGIPL